MAISCCTATTQLDHNGPMVSQECGLKRPALVWVVLHFAYDRLSLNQRHHQDGHAGLRNATLKSFSFFTRPVFTLNCIQKNKSLC